MHQSRSYPGDIKMKMLPLVVKMIVIPTTKNIRSKDLIRIC